jgi:uncharacterized repeat protein (TIGR01451 family)
MGSPVERQPGPYPTARPWLLRGSCVTAMLMLLTMTPAGPASAAAALTIRPISWNVIGLDSNKVTDGPDTFPVGASVCNTGDAAATNVVSSLVWDTANIYVSVFGPSTITLGSLAASSCADFYYEVLVVRNSSAYNTTRGYHITAAADGVSVISTPTPRELFIEHLVSQNRNSVQAITGPGGMGDPPATTVYVGGTYTYKLFSSTAPGGYEQLESFINLPNTVFQILSVFQTYSTPPGATNDTVYGDACGWDNVPTSPTYRSCIGPFNYPGGKVGNNVVTTYNVKILSVGSANVTALIYDFSGSSYHYNSDFGTGVNSLSITALPSADLSVSVSHSAPFIVGQQGTYTISVSDLGPSDAAGTLTVTDTLPAGLTYVSGGGNGWSCSAVGQNVTCTHAAALVNGGSTSFPITVAVGAGAVPQVTDQATVSSPTHDPVSANNTGQDVTPIDRPPVAQDDSAATAQDTPVTIPVLANDSDPDGDALTVTVTTPPSNGSAVVNPDKTITYTPGPGFTGTDSFVYQICDPSGACDTATVSILVPTAVTFEGAVAFPRSRGVAVAWRTGFEAGNLGFNVYGQERGQRVRLNPTPLAGSALLVGRSTPVSGEKTYSLFDPRGQAGSHYWIEDLDVGGRSTWHGPVAVRPSVPPWAASAAPAVPLSAVGRSSAGGGQPTPRVGSGGNLGAGQGNGHAVKILVDHEGWYRVPLATLADLGIDTSHPGRIRVVAEGRKQSVRIRKRGLEFYGLGLDTTSTATRVYWVSTGRSQGARIPVVGGSADGTPAGHSFRATVTRQDRTVYFASLRNGDADNFFGALVSTVPTTETIDVPKLSGAAGARLEVSVQGVTGGLHDVEVELNGVRVGSLTFRGQALADASFAAPSISKGANDITLSTTSDSDYGLIRALSVTYRRRFVATDNSLRFTVAGGTRVSVSGFSDPAIRLMDATDPARPVEVTPEVSTVGGGYSATATMPGHGSRTVYAFAPSAVQSPASVVADRPSSLRSAGNAADLVIVTTADLAPSLPPLVALREHEGLRVKVVDVQDVYDQFSFGEKDPAAIRAFLALAAARWSAPPRYLLLFGDGTYDPRGWLGGRPDLVPTKLRDTTFMESASDGWYVDWDGDGVPDLPVGRIPAADPGQAAAIVAKLVAYDRSSASPSVVTAADRADSYDFPAAMAGLAGSVPPAVATISLVRPQIGNAALTAAIDSGPTVVDYLGHGNVDSWAGGWLTATDGQRLSNSAHPALFVLMTCLNGYFTDPHLTSMGESLLEAPGGAVAVWGSAGLVDPASDLAMNEALFGRLFDPGGLSGTRLGDAALAAERAATNPDVLTTATLLGDPTMTLR